MRHMGKKLLALGMAVGILISSSVRAEEQMMEPPTEPLMVPTMALLPRVRADLSINKRGRVKVSAIVRSKSEVKRISGTVSLERYSSGRRKWKELRKWKVEKNCANLSVSYSYRFSKKYKKSKKKGKYRVRVRLLTYEGEGQRGVPANRFSKTRKY